MIQSLGQEAPADTK